MALDIDYILLLQTYLLLLFGHCLADFPLQGEYLAKNKNHLINPTGVWVICLFTHGMIHAGMVFIITGELYLAAMMFITHVGIDMLKSNGDFGRNESKAFVTDQVLHALVLLIIAALYCGS